MRGASGRAHKRTRASQSKLSRRAVLALIDKVLDATSSNSSDDSSDSHIDSDAENIRPSSASHQTRPRHALQRRQDDSPPRRKYRRISDEPRISSMSSVRADRSPPRSLSPTVPEWVRPEAIQELGQDVAEVIGEAAPQWLAEDPAAVHKLELGIARVVAEFALKYGVGAELKDKRQDYDNTSNKDNVRRTPQFRAPVTSSANEDARWHMPRATDRLQIEGSQTARSPQLDQPPIATALPEYSALTVSRSAPDASDLDQPELSSPIPEDGDDGGSQAQSHSNPPRTKPSRRPWSEEETHKLRELKRMGVPTKDAPAYLAGRTKAAVSRRWSILTEGGKTSGQLSDT